MATTATSPRPRRGRPRRLPTTGLSSRRCATARARTTTVIPAFLSLAAAKAGPVAGELAGVGSLGGAGFLHDVAGDDTYDIISSVDSAAEATAMLADSPTEALANASRPDAWGQGSGIQGYGELRDTGGTDSYAATAVNDARAEDSRVWVLPVAYVQADSVRGFGHLLDVDAAAADTLSSVPAHASCVGTRGQGVWVACMRDLGVDGVPAGIGVND